MYAATDIGPVVFLELSLSHEMNADQLTVIASPSIFANGVDHVRSEPEEAVVFIEDEYRIAY